VASFVAGITLASGVLYLLLAVLGMGWVAQFLSRAVVTGFLFGAAIDVVVGELPKVTGTKASGSNSFQELRSWLGSLDQPMTQASRCAWRGSNPTSASP
jgi:MFS superfamily sulfate permease-like transporter